MLWSVFTHLAGFIVDLAVGARRAEQAKDLEIALLRHQLRLLQRRSPGRPRLARWEKLTFAVLAAKRSRLTSGPRAQLARAVLLVQPATVLQWHRELSIAIEIGSGTHVVLSGARAPHTLSHAHGGASSRGGGDRCGSRSPCRNSPT